MPQLRQYFFDGGNYLFTDEEKELFIKKEPKSIPFIKPILSGEEFINVKNRWVLYLAGIEPNKLTEMPLVLERVNAVRNYRKLSTKLQTQEKSNYPTLFAEPRQPNGNFFLIPRTSSENRKYIPIGFFSKDFIVNDSCTALPDATNFHFGILTSLMHNVWTSVVCGRLGSSFRYSNIIVYNNYPWPSNPTDKQIKTIEIAAQKVLDARILFSNSSLAELYDLGKMPPVLVKAHIELDKAVDLTYRSQPFTTVESRMEFLFELYEKYTANLFTLVKEKKKKLSKK